ncbi:uncharacterized protein [Euphorbia lathyris]|uniref:uncharacterized protein n=1 Tax=Euphorbia lathyris TaxID=212925 RepID=UPI00331339D8
MAMSSQSRRSSSGPVLRSGSPCGRFRSVHSDSYFSSSSSSAFASSTSSSFHSPPSSFFNSDDHHHHHRSASPTRVNIYTTSTTPSPSFRVCIGRSSSPNRSISSVAPQKNPISLRKKTKTCMCSPTSHPGSFRCSLHKNTGSHSHGSDSYTPNRLNMRRSAMKNSIVRIGGVEGDWVMRALTALIRPSSHQQKRRGDFQPRPSRLSVMSKADDPI